MQKRYREVLKSLEKYIVYNIRENEHHVPDHKQETIAEPQTERNMY